MTIKAVYQVEPNFPATTQHPAATRYVVGHYFVDAIGGEPSEQDVFLYLVGGLAGMRATVDQHAEAARGRYVSHPLMAAEYEQAERDATAFKAAGYAGAVPGSVSVWATAKGWTARQAADDILAAAAMLRAKLLQIRAVRLAGKEAIAGGTKTLVQVLAELAAL